MTYLFGDILPIASHADSLSLCYESKATNISKIFR